uniref:Fibronectin type-III domain-containing protein n=1 Tax=Macrostomum lignano TaxID=282301 RepID=A0A1I8FK95_9PLAT
RRRRPKGVFKSRSSASTPDIGNQSWPRTGTETLLATCLTLGAAPVPCRLESRGSGSKRRVTVRPAPDNESEILDVFMIELFLAGKRDPHGRPPVVRKPMGSGPARAAAAAAAAAGCCCHRHWRMPGIVGGSRSSQLSWRLGDSRRRRTTVIAANLKQKKASQLKEAMRSSSRRWNRCVSRAARWRRRRRPRQRRPRKMKLQKDDSNKQQAGVLVATPIRQTVVGGPRAGGSCRSTRLALTEAAVCTKLNKSKQVVHNPGPTRCHLQLRLAQRASVGRRHGRLEVVPPTGSDPMDPTDSVAQGQQSRTNEHAKQPVKEQLQSAKRILEIGLRNVSDARSATVLADGRSVCDSVWSQEVNPHLFDARKLTPTSSSPEQCRYPASRAREIDYDQVEARKIYPRGVKPPPYPGFDQLYQSANRNGFSRGSALRPERTSSGGAPGGGSTFRRCPAARSCFELIDEAIGLMAKHAADESLSTAEERRPRRSRTTGDAPRRADSAEAVRTRDDTEAGALAGDARGVAWYACFARPPTGSNVATLRRSTVRPRGVPVPAFNCQFRVIRTQPNQKYVFAVAAYEPRPSRWQQRWTVDSSNSGESSAADHRLRPCWPRRLPHRSLRASKRNLRGPPVAPIPPSDELALTSRPEFRLNRQRANRRIMSLILRAMLPGHGRAMWLNDANYALAGRSGVTAYGLLAPLVHYKMQTRAVPAARLSDAPGAKDSAGRQHARVRPEAVQPDGPNCRQRIDCRLLQPLLTLSARSATTSETSFASGRKKPELAAAGGGAGNVDKGGSAGRRWGQQQRGTDTELSANEDRAFCHAYGRSCRQQGRLQGSGEKGLSEGHYDLVIEWTKETTDYLDKRNELYTGSSHPKNQGWRRGRGAARCVPTGSVSDQSKIPGASVSEFRAGQGAEGDSSHRAAEAAAEEATAGWQPAAGKKKYKDFYHPSMKDLPPETLAAYKPMRTMTDSQRQLQEELRPKLWKCSAPTYQSWSSATQRESDSEKLCAEERPWRPDMCLVLGLAHYWQLHQQVRLATCDQLGIPSNISQRARVRRGHFWPSCRTQAAWLGSQPAQLAANLSCDMRAAALRWVSKPNSRKDFLRNVKIGRSGWATEECESSGQGEAASRTPQEGFPMQRGLCRRRPRVPRSARGAGKEGVDRTVVRRPASDTSDALTMRCDRSFRLA